MSTQLVSINATENERVKFLVYGFIKMMLTQLFTDKIDSPYYNIPTTVIDICIWFYHYTDCFSMSGSALKINKTGDTVTCVSAQRHSVFGNIEIDLNEINNMIYKWDLKILQFDDNDLMGIGFASDRTTCLNGDFCDIKTPEVYFEVDNDGDIDSNTRTNNKVHCEQGFGTGDAVGIVLDTKNKTILFLINEIDQGILFSEIPKKKYYLAVTFRSVGDSVKIVDFDQLQWCIT